MFKVINKNIRTTSFFVNFEHISHLSLVFLLLTLKKVNASWNTNENKDLMYFRKYLYIPGVKQLC